jgi:futalosine hydrolase
MPRPSADVSPERGHDIPPIGRSDRPRLLVVCATAAERDAAARTLAVVTVAGRPDLLRAETGGGRVDLMVGGVGVAAAAAATAAELAGALYDVVLSVGIAGGFAPVAVGGTVVASAVVEADLGAEDGDAFLPLSALGLGDERHDLDPALVGELAGRTGALVGAVLSVSTVTGSVATAASRLRRTPDAAAEAMEGAGVLAAAGRFGVPFAEVRTISNRVGPRDRDAWRIGPALDALGSAIAALTASPLKALGAGRAR